MKEMLVEKGVLMTNYTSLRTSLESGFYICLHADFLELLEVIPCGDTEIHRYWLINGD